MIEINVTYYGIMDFKPCYNPTDIGMPTDYSDTLVNWMKEYRPKVRNLQDINWVAMRFLDKKTRDYYTWWCVNEVKHLMKDERSVKAVNTLKDYIDGVATIEELKSAYANADAAYDAYAAYDAVYAVYAANAYTAATAAAYAADANAAITDRQIDKLIEILEGK